MKKSIFVLALLLGAITGQPQTYGTAVPVYINDYSVHPYYMDNWYLLFRMQQDLKAIRSEVETMNEGLVQQVPLQVPPVPYSNLPALMQMLKDGRRWDSIRAVNPNYYNDTIK